jgi:hypothetical protein
MPLRDRLVILRDELDPADDARIERRQVLGGNPVLKDGLTTDLAYLVGVEEGPADLEAVTYPEPDAGTFHSRAILVAYSSFRTG